MGPVYTGQAIAGWHFGDRVAGMAVDSDENFVVAGTFVDSLSFGGLQYAGSGFDDMYVLKASRAGKPLYSHLFANSKSQTLSVMARAGDGSIVIAGYFSGALPLDGVAVNSITGDDGFVAKLSPEGLPLWAHLIAGDGEERPRAVAIDDDSGRIALGGTFTGALHDGAQVSFSAGGTDGFVFVFDADGNQLASRLFGAGGDDMVTTLAWLDGDVVFAGEFQETLDFGAAGVHVSVGGSDAFVARLSATDAELIWSHAYGDGGAQHVGALHAANSRIALALSVDGVVDVGGGVISANDTDGAVVVLDGNGTYQTHFTVDGAGEQWLTAVRWLSDGGLILGGHFQSILGINGNAEAATADGGDSFLLRVAAPSKNITKVHWVQHFASSNPAAVRSIQQSASGIIVAGDFTDTLQVGSIQLVSEGPTDTYLLRLAP